MRRSSSTSTKRSAEKQSRATSTGKRSRTRGALRKAAMTLGVAAIAWAAMRRMRSGDGMPSTDGVRERASEAVPDAVAERAGVGTSSESKDDWMEQSTGETDMGFGGDRRAGSSGPQPDQTSSVDASMSEGEIEERFESDADEEPAPPGEMNVDDEVAGEVFDQDDVEDGSLEAEEDMLGQDETDMEEDEDEDLEDR